MSLGFEQAGFDVVAAVDFDPLLAGVHKYNHPATRTLCRDVASLVGSARTSLGIGDVELDAVFGGPPCQGFSSIGKRQVDDPRNSLVEAFVKVAVELQPLCIVMENVEGIMQPGMASHLQRAKALLTEAGYHFAEPTKMDASEYGVPQRRRRVFLVAWRKTLDAFQWPLATHGKSDTGLFPIVTVKAAIGDLAAVGTSTKSAYARALGASASVGLAARRLKRVRGLSGLDPTQHTAQTIMRFGATDPGKEEPVSRYTRLRWDGVCHTMRAGTGPDRGSFMSARPIHPSEPRVITVREAARLHGYPDWFQFHRTKWHSFRGIGNSVPPPMAAVVARAVSGALHFRPPTAQPVALGDRALLSLSPETAAKHFCLDAAARPRRKREQPTAGRQHPAGLDKTRTSRLYAVW